MAAGVRERLCGTLKVCQWWPPWHLTMQKYWTKMLQKQQAWFSWRHQISDVYYLREIPMGSHAFCKSFNSLVAAFKSWKCRCQSNWLLWIFEIIHNDSIFFIDNFTQCQKQPATIGNSLLDKNVMVTTIWPTNCWCLILGKNMAFRRALVLQKFTPTGCRSQKKWKIGP